jgi:hypothetical protein|tara:strand:+ start:145 stop:462 length:318 start_codon:yes stop_codon:yes gene_type:complete
MTQEDKYRANFEACVEDLREPLIKVSKDYDIDVLISSLYEIGMRLSLLKYGTMGSFGLLADVLHTFTSAGPLIDEMQKAQDKTGNTLDSIFIKLKENQTDPKTKH